jgi:hypothetical protein
VDKPSITYTPRSITPQAEIATLVNVYRFVLDSANRNAAGMTSTNGTSGRNTEEVSDVGQRPD